MLALNRSHLAMGKCYFVLSVLLGVGCSGELSRVNPPAYNTAAGATALEQYDTNRDTFLSGEELAQVPALRESLASVDTNQDNQLSADEINARVQNWLSLSIGEMPVRCEVFWDGQPLTDARIVFEPEPLLGKHVHPAEGQVMETGTAGISMAKEHLADPKYAGVACGWYKIRVTHPTLAIPARYNTATILGCEVAMDASWTNHGAVELKLTSK